MILFLSLDLSILEHRTVWSSDIHPAYHGNVRPDPMWRNDFKIVVVLSFRQDTSLPEARLR